MANNPISWEAAVSAIRAEPEFTQLVEECFFDDPLDAAANRYYQSSEWASVRKLLAHREGKALDIGAGRGISSYALARDGWQVTALEPDPSDLVGAGAIRDLSNTTGVDIAVVEDWGESLPFPAGSFDLVYGRQVLHHARDLSSFCREIGRVLKPGGVLLASREHVVFRDGDLDKFLCTHPLHKLYGGEHAYRLSEYKSAIQGAGLHITQVLNPWSSAINLYPKTAESLAEMIHAKLPIIPTKILSPSLLARLGWLYRSPGAAYSFVGIRESR